MVVFAQVRFGVTPQINAMAPLLLAGTIILLGLALLIISRSRRSGRYQFDGAAAATWRLRDASAITSA
jgi:hypothetical protein